MDRYPLAGEEFFREMMRPEEERRQSLADRSIGGGVSNPSNVVSLQEYKQRQTEHRNPWRGK
jgi:hypothetical protein